MDRFGITIMKSFKEAIKDIPDDYFIGTNEVGNISVYTPIKEGNLEVFGYIELWNLAYFEGNNQESPAFRPERMSRH